MIAPADLLTLVLTTGLGKWRDHAPCLTILEYRRLLAALFDNNLPITALLDDQKAAQDALFGLGAFTKNKLKRLLTYLDTASRELALLSSMGAMAVTESMDIYPKRLRLLQKEAPAALFYFGDISIAQKSGISVMGSRRLPADARAFAWRIGEKCAQEGLCLFSGGAYGADASAETQNLLSGGDNVTILPDGFLRRDVLARRRPLVTKGRQLFFSPFHPLAPFTAYTALWRNHMVSAMGRASILITCRDGAGGSFRGAEANLQNGWCKQYSLIWPSAAAGNQRLVSMGAKPLSGHLLKENGFQLQSLL